MTEKGYFSGKRGRSVKRKDKIMIGINGKRKKGCNNERKF